MLVVFFSCFIYLPLEDGLFGLLAYVLLFFSSRVLSIEKSSFC